ncbi:MAG: hypothetical protein U0401_26645 [Anaerolineae bacterium]
MNGRGKGLSTITTYLDCFEKQVAVNVHTHVSHGTVRMAVMGMDNRAPTTDELSRMQRLIDQSMRGGAIGSVHRPDLCPG